MLRRFWFLIGFWWLGPSLFIPSSSVCSLGWEVQVPSGHRGPICRRRLCLHSPVIRRTMDCVVLCADSSDVLCPRLWCHHRVSVGEWHRHWCTVWEFRLMAWNSAGRGPAGYWWTWETNSSRLQYVFHNSFSPFVPDQNDGIVNMEKCQKKSAKKIGH